MAKFERKYICVRDRQGGSFAVGRTLTIEEWRKQALEWLYQDDAEEDYIRFIKKLNKKYVIDEIAGMWALEIIPIEELPIEEMWELIDTIYCQTYKLASLLTKEQKTEQDKEFAEYIESKTRKIYDKVV